MGPKIVPKGAVNTAGQVCTVFVPQNEEAIGDYTALVNEGI